jgi:single-strand DNA-binding protein
MINKVIIMGRITKELEIRQSQSGTAVLRFTVAVDRPQKNGEKSADFINCIAFGQTAEFIGRYFGKGRMIAIEGNIKTGSYQNKNGDTVYTTDVIVERTSFTGEPKNENNGGYSGGNNQGYSNTQIPYNTPQGTPQNATGAYTDYEDVISDSGIPF